MPRPRGNCLNPITHEKDYSPAELAFLRAMDRYKRENQRPYPTWHEVLEVLLSLGYRKVADEGELPQFYRQRS